MQTKSRLRTEFFAALFLVFPATASAQTPAFAVASVKLHKDGPIQRSGFSGGRFTFTGPLIFLIAEAYQLPVNSSPRLTGAPQWLGGRNDMYDIDANGTFPDNLTTSARKERERLMLQSLLADRFKLVIRHETKEMPVYVLVVDAGGPKLEKSSVTEADCPQAESDGQVPCHQFNGGQGRGLHARAASMDDLASFVENWTNRPLLNRTGITGLWKIESQPWLSIDAPDNPPAPGAKGEGGVDMADLPTLFQVFEKLGLKMKADRAAVEAYTIVDIQRPTEN
ncbi:MAG TPA: TIGR03435 family protein [Bryobacteraceae bacterium]|nr:TIGR03435 family protein [Bryobacteraceae bacterium]